jgi:hypothetical protein
MNTAARAIVLQQLVSRERSATLRTCRLYSFAFVVRSFAASGFAGLAGFGSVSNDWIDVRIIDAV